jgi:hypothetical protein
VLRVGISIAFGVTVALLALPFAAVRRTGNDYMEAQTWSGLALTLRRASRPHLEELIWDQQRRAYVMHDFGAVYGVPGVVLPVQWGFIVAAVLIVAGLCAEILAGVRWRAAVQMVAGFGAGAALTIGELVLHSSVRTPLFDKIEPVPAYGFWLTLGLLVTLGFAGLVTLLLTRSDKGMAERHDHEVAQKSRDVGGPEHSMDSGPADQRSGAGD